MPDATAPRPAAAGRKVLVWDLPTRLFHWLLVLGLIGSWLTAEVYRDVDFGWHKLIGSTILGLLLFRLLWGFLGGRHSRFASFVPGPRAVFAYLRVFARRDAPRHAGHNPLGALSVLALLASLLAQVASGLVIDDGILAAGPLAKLVDGELRALAGSVHEINFNVLLALIALHLLAIVYYTVWRRQNLAGAMVTGRAAGLPDSAAGTAPPLWRFLLAAGLATGLTFAIVEGLPAWLPAAGGGGDFNFD